MNLTITFGWWLVPFLISVAAALWIPFGQRSIKKKVGEIGELFIFIPWSMAIILSLMVWLIWSLIA